MTIIFSDDFENRGIGEWTEFNGTFNVTGDSAFEGSAGIELSIPDTYLYKDFSTPDSYFVSIRAMIQFPEVLSGSGRLRILQLNQSTSYIALLYYENNQYKLEIRNPDNTVSNLVIDFNPIIDTWYDIELVYEWSLAGKVSLYVDGSKIDELNENSTSGSDYTITRGFILSYIDSGTVAGRVYFDNVCIADTPQTYTAIEYTNPISYRYTDVGTITVSALNTASISAGSINNGEL